ncbi:MinD/ParA family ATP-binding protein [Nocardia heshunensis]
MSPPVRQDNPAPSPDVSFTAPGGRQENLIAPPVMPAQPGPAALGHQGRPVAAYPGADPAGPANVYLPPRPRPAYGPPPVPGARTDLVVRQTNQQPGPAAPTFGELAPTGPERAAGLSIALTPAELLDQLTADRSAHLRSTTGMRGALNKVGFNLGLSPDELRTEERRARIRRQLTSAYQIAVVNVKGGVGRTTTVAGLGSIFAAFRPDRVVAVDANPDFGDLSGRTGRHQYGLTLRDLVQARGLDSFAAVQSFTTINNADLAVVASPWSSTTVESLSGREYLAAAEVLRRHFNLMLIDCGTGLLDSATAGVLQTSHAIVLATPATVRGVTGAVATLEWLDSHGMHRLAAESIIVITHQYPMKPTVAIERIEELFAAAHRPAVVIPYDDHLAEGGEIDLRLLEKETVLAFEELAATLADGFPSHMTGGIAHADRGGRP